MRVEYLLLLTAYLSVSHAENKYIRTCYKESESRMADGLNSVPHQKW